jgi:hypothetical protein
LVLRSVDECVIQSGIRPRSETGKAQGEQVLDSTVTRVVFGKSSVYRGRILDRTTTIGPNRAFRYHWRNGENKMVAFGSILRKAGVGTAGKRDYTPVFSPELGVLKSLMFRDHEHGRLKKKKTVAVMIFCRGDITACFSLRCAIEDVCLRPSLWSTNFWTNNLKERLGGLLKMSLFQRRSLPRPPIAGF